MDFEGFFWKILIHLQHPVNLYKLMHRFSYYCVWCVAGYAPLSTSSRNYLPHSFPVRGKWDRLNRDLLYNLRTRLLEHLEYSHYFGLHWIMTTLSLQSLQSLRRCTENTPDWHHGGIVWHRAGPTSRGQNAEVTEPSRWMCLIILISHNFSPIERDPFYLHWSQAPEAWAWRCREKGIGSSTTGCRRRRRGGRE